jgi:uroporphyrinogen decarboxylase
MMNKRQRVEAVLRGDKPDGYPVCFWHHFPPSQITGQAAVDAHLSHLERYDLDFLKVMNDHHYPRGDIGVVRSCSDLKKLRVLSGTQDDFAGQLEVLSRLRQKLGDEIFTCTTLFNAWTILRKLVAPPDDRHGPPKLDNAIDERDRTISSLLAEDRAAVQAALQTIAASLANFARACIDAGAMGIFLSVRDDWVNTAANGLNTYDEMVEPADRAILRAVSHAPFNWVHVCGRPLNFSRFIDYPAAVLNWADRAAGPRIADVRDQIKASIAGGVDNLRTLPKGTPADVAAEVQSAIVEAKPRPIFVTPGCTYAPQAVPAQNLEALVAAARL